MLNLKREADILKSLPAHPNVVSFVDSVEDSLTRTCAVGTSAHCMGLIRIASRDLPSVTDGSNQSNPHDAE